MNFFLDFYLLFYCFDVPKLYHLSHHPFPPPLSSLPKKNIFPRLFLHTPFIRYVCTSKIEKKFYYRYIIKSILQSTPIDQWTRNVSEIDKWNFFLFADLISSFTLSTSIIIGTSERRKYYFVRWIKTWTMKIITLYRSTKSISAHSLSEGRKEGKKKGYLVEGS